MKTGKKLSTAYVLVHAIEIPFFSQKFFTVGAHNVS